MESSVECTSSLIIKKQEIMVRGPVLYLLILFNTKSRPEQNHVAHVFPEVSQEQTKVTVLNTQITNLSKNIFSQMK